MKHIYADKAQIVFETLGIIIQEERIKKNKSQRILAYEYNLQKSMISRLEHGKNDPKLSSVFSLCEALGLKPSELLKKVEDRLPDNFSLIES